METIYYNGNIITMDDNHKFVQAVYVKNGIIKKIGNNEEILKFQTNKTEVIDLQGKTMLPGFVDAHSHFMGVVNSLLQCDLSDAVSFEEIIEKMKQFIESREIHKNEFVIGTNYDHNFLKEKKHPDKYILDKIGNYPIMIIHASSHMGVVNSKGLEMMGLNKSVEDMPGGHYGRIEHSNELNGYMEENAFIEFRNKLPMGDIKEFLKMIEKAQNLYASYGITTLQEGMVTKDLYKLLTYVKENKMLKLDLVGYLDIKEKNSLDKTDLTYHNHFRIGGYKMFLDGSPQGKTAWMSKTYENELDYCGYPILSDKEVYENIKLSMKEHMQLLTHCNGDSACEQLISQSEKVIHDHPQLKPYRNVMIHAQLVRKDQLKRMSQIGMIPSFFIAHIYHWGDIHKENFGERAEFISPVKTANDLHLPFTFHQDSPVLQPDLTDSLYSAVYRETRTGNLLGQSEKIDMYTALKGITIHGAFQYGEENLKGSISEGKHADFVILNLNPLEYHLKDVKVLETIKDGITVYKQ